jgi:crotonobetainyl-CoA:carnitine CoA-transferase CaiB-like acyl-CoA transferase
MVATVKHPAGRTVRMPGNPVKLSETGEDSYSSPPLLGAHTDEVLVNFAGLDPEEVSQLRRQRVVA